MDMYDTYKKETLEAVKTLIKRFDRDDHERLFSTFECPLCQIYCLSTIKCEGCFLLYEKNRCSVGILPIATRARSFAFKGKKEAARERRAAYKLCADALRAATVILENTPAEQFTPNGWKRFDEIFLMKEATDEYSK